MNDQTGHTLDCTLYGVNIKNKGELKHPAMACYPKGFSDDYFMDNESFTSTLKIDLPDNAVSVVKQSYEFAKKHSEKADPIYIGCFLESSSHC